MIDQDPATLLEIIEHLPGALYDWVIGQTLAALGGRLRPSEARAELEMTSSHDHDAVRT